jgi:hypothetical protein
LDYAVPGMLGFLTGAGLFAYIWKDIFPKINQIANYGNKNLPSLWNVNPILMGLIFITFTLLLFYLLERKTGQRADKMTR